MDNWGRSGWRTLLVVGCLIVAAVSGGTVTGQHAEVNFSNPTMVEQQGDIASIPLSFSNTNQAALEISSASNNYSVSLRVIDGNEDGQVTVAVDTLNAENPKAAYHAKSGGDSVSVTSQTTHSEGKLLPTGRYNLIVSSGSTRVASVLWLTAPTVYGSTSYTLSGETSTTGLSEYRFETNTRDNTSKPLDVAAGDLAVVNFHVSGLGSELQSTKSTPPTIYANESTPGAQTNHVLQLSASNRTIQSQSLSIRYGAAPAFSSQQLVQAIGIDTNSNGIIDQSLKPRISSYKTTSNGELTIFFTDQVSVRENETLLFQYSVKNPNESEDRVRISFGDYQQTETIQYGLAGQGTLGSGVDLQIHSNNTQVVSPLIAIDESYSSNVLSTVTDTGELPSGTYTITLTIDSRTYPTGKHVTLRESFTVRQPSVRDLMISTSNNTVLISARTNYAAGTPLIIEVSSSKSNFQFLSRHAVLVNRNGTVSSEVTIPSRSTGPVNISIIHKGDVVSEPIEYHPTNETKMTSIPQ